MKIIAVIIFGLAIGGLLPLWGSALAQYNPYTIPTGPQSFEDRLYRELQRQQYEIQEQLRQQEQRRQMDEQNRELQRQTERIHREHMERNRRQMEGQRQPYYSDPYRW